MKKGFSGPPTSPPDPSQLSTHTHRWGLLDTIYEDYAAILLYECRWVEKLDSSTGPRGETYYREGAECEREKTVRFELDWVERIREDEPNIKYFDNGDFNTIVEQAMQSLHNGGLPRDTTSFDPDENDGHSIVENKRWRAKYTA